MPSSTGSTAPADRPVRGHRQQGAASSVDDDEFDLDGDVDDLIESIIDEHVDCIHEICSTYPVGTVVVRLGDLVMTRAYPSAA